LGEHENTIEKICVTKMCYFTFVKKQEALPQKSGTSCVKGGFQARLCGNVGMKLTCVTRLPVIISIRLLEYYYNY